MLLRAALVALRFKYVKEFSLTFRPSNVSLTLKILGVRARISKWVSAGTLHEYNSRLWNLRSNAAPEEFVRPLKLFVRAVRLFCKETRVHAGTLHKLRNFLAMHESAVIFLGLLS
jgi:hypothetical protein